jgi:hypothetical protein
MKSWLNQLRYNPLPLLLDSQNQAINYFARKDLLDEKTVAQPDFTAIPAVNKLLRHQHSNGSWRYPADKGEQQSNYDQLETYRNLGILAEKYGFTRSNSAIEKAAKFLFTFQTPAGDFRGIYGNQYSPNYTAGIMEILIKCGYADDVHISKGFEWLLYMRQRDGGWAIPLRTRKIKMDTASLTADTAETDKNMPFSHMVTGVVLRAFAAHPHYRKSGEARKAAELLASRLFMKDNYPTDRGAVEYWFKFTYPFWFTDLISALDSLSCLGFSPAQQQIHGALDWFRENQQPDGGWKLKALKQASDSDTDLWLNLAVCRIFKRFYGG